MSTLVNILLWSGTAGIIIALLFSLGTIILRRRTGTAKIPDRLKRMMDTAATALAILALVSVTFAIVNRTIETSHAPFSNMYEFALSFSWGVILIGLLFRWKHRTVALQNIGLIIALPLLIFARLQYSEPVSLVPALQQSTLLTAHVASAIIAYSTLTIGFGTAVLFLFQSRSNSRWLPDKEVLDNISYHSVVIGFPFLTLLIILGAFWADIAWGRYWNWDPKETASLVTWLIYAGYMHARVIRGWRGNKAALLLIIGFLAILLTFFGNYIFSGLHVYG